MREDIAYWVGLTQVEGLGARGAHRMVEHFGSPQGAYMASLTELEASGLPAQVCRAVFEQAGLREAEREVEKVKEARCEIITWADEEYPPAPKQIADPPLLLYARGNVKVLSRHAVAVVGTRRPTPYGLQVTRRLAKDLAERQLVIVSGLARGIDSAAHFGALDAQGVTVAVQGRGMDEIYPAENKKLAEKILESGAVISEFPLGTGPMPENFPIRNRIISGLSLGVMVVEASEYSGSLITARLATEQNREVFAVPGNVTSPQSLGPNYLIKQGAKLVDQWMDVIEEFPPQVRGQLLPADADRETQPISAENGLLFDQSLTGEQKQVFEILRPDQAVFVDDIFNRVTLPQARILQALLELEMSGLIRQLPGKNFIRKL